MSTPGYYELYRRSTVGSCLVDALDTLISDGRIEASLAMKVLESFDKVVSESLRENTQSKLNVKGLLDTYGFCDDVWTFIIKDCKVTVESNKTATITNENGEQVTSTTDEQQTIQVDKLRIVACNSKKGD
ncbi:hypothetical protein TPHA_0C02690 [Tetrapisispora phaffii CBS 4417]|uniref:Transcription initiation factor IIA subunit 2 n=1 Tax=Tetrapisispora phaffii (strain ATCC 24235 / CBS 4417 / NBRC 1672 / NRRL Y-8282 / UCD 70-5) TaxID=1071381 RepID=G8BRP6_TETPH|nr:hypothetical protein TPHA_0C02690 [Tetrapisispora phaffii CBS 4417]CCE62422.1 hypothetical protein TPHA_0C02690 [Tetrapisispora phaffii CBS 4417]